MDHGIETAAVQPGRQFGWRYDVRELPLSEIAPFAAMAEQVANSHVRAAGLIESGHEVRPDKTGTTGHQQHSLPYP